MREVESVRRLVRLALDEDLPYGDITSDLTVGSTVMGNANVISREPLVFCGGELISIIADEGRADIAVKLAVKDGEEVPPQTVCAELSGTARSLLSLERTILNFLQRLCGVATYTNHLVRKAGPLALLDTRKTMPGFRYLDKYAVRVGGGRNHRANLSEMILVKNNHIDVNPIGLQGVLDDIFKTKPVYLAVEVEVRNLDELSTALQFPIDVVMFDNFSDEEIAAAVKVVTASRIHPFMEVSGGVTGDRLSTLSKLGVNGVSMGALTTRAPNVDISMRITPT